jgi:hypothetical protein
MQNYHANLKLKIAGLLAASVAFLPATSQAEDDAVFSVNIVGFQKQDLPPSGQFVLASVPFETGDPATLLSVFGTNSLRQANNPTLCDRIILFDATSQTYQTWAQWTDGNFYRANNLSQWQADIQSNNPGNPEIPAGTGYWMLSSSSSATNSITYVGNVVMTDQQVVAMPVGLDIRGYPFSSAVSIADIGFVSSGAAGNNNYLLADQISIYENGAYRTYALRAGKWYEANSLANWQQAIEADFELQPGQGFFYRARSAFSWTENNPYLMSLE